MKKKRTSPTTPTSGETTRTKTEWPVPPSEVHRHPFAWSPGYVPKGKERDPFGGYKERYATLPKQYPTIFEYSSETHAKTLRVKAMRKSIGHVGYVGNLLGYRPDAILAFERGYDRDGKALPEKKWKRYTWALIGLYMVHGAIDGQEARRKDAQGDARVQTRQPTPGDRKAGQEGRKGHKPKAGDRHRFERSAKGGRGGWVQFLPRKVTIQGA